VKVEAEREHLRVAAEAAAAAQARLEDTLERETVARADSAALLAQTEAALEGLRSAQARYEAEAAIRAAEIARVVAERDRLVAERDAARTELERRAELAASVASPVEVVTVTSSTREALEEEETSAEAAVVVLDVHPAWRDARARDHRVIAITPDADAAARIATLRPARVVVNLAAPEGLRTVAALRAGGSATRVWGCIADPASDRVLALGMIEPAALPLDPDAVVETLGGYLARGSRIVTAGADVDALMSLRQALSRKGMSVSMAWDAKQAADLLAVVRPHVVVVDLDLLRRDGYAIAAALAGISPVPHAVLIGGGETAAGAFAETLGDAAHASRAVTLEEFLGNVLRQSEAPPAPERRQKVRAITFK